MNNNSNYEIGVKFLSGLGKFLLVLILAFAIWFWLIPVIQSTWQDWAKCTSVGAAYGGGECYGAGIKLDMDNLASYAKARP